MKLEGSTDTFPLRELIDMAIYSSVTGVLNIYGPGEPGRLFFRESTLYHVERGPARGVDALAELLELDHASFSFVSDVASEEESLWGALSYHLQTAERSAERWRQIRAYVSSLDLTPHLLAPREALQRRANPAHHPVLAAIDGQTSLRQIAAGLAWAPVDVAEAAMQLSLDGMIELKYAQAAASQGSTPRPPGGGLFDRFMLMSAAGRSVEKEPARREADPLARMPSEDTILQLLRESA